MTTKEILEKCVQCMIDNCESDMESYMVGYYLSYQDGKIKLTRVVRYPNGESYSDGGIDLNSSESICFEEEATITSYCNIAVYLHQTDDYELERIYSYDIFALQLRSVKE